MSLFGRTKDPKKMIDIAEAFNIWDILNSKYMARERLNMWETLLHDQDLKAIVKCGLNSLDENIYILEGLMAENTIKSPDRRRENIDADCSSKIISDEFMALDYLLYLQEHTENLMRSLRTSVTNDTVRRKIKKMSLKTIDETDTLIKYLTAKGWIEQPPLYKEVPPNAKDTISTIEAFNLWDHLSYRYDNIRTTERYLSLAHDSDFKVVIDIGLEKLKNQSNLIKKETTRYGIPIPKEPGIISDVPSAFCETFNDDHLFREILKGLQGAALMHSNSLKNSTHNDRVRKLFKKLLQQELDYIDDFIKYGKSKGWLNPVPTYG